MADEQLRCNICGVAVSASQVKLHVSTSSHESCQSEVEQDLKKARNENYKNDSSVIDQWEGSV
jgi:hypothetical protein